MKRATGIKVAVPGMTARQAEALARQTAQMMEAAAKGQTPCQKAVAAVRAAAVAFGAAQHVPTVREFLAAVPVTAGASAEANRRRAFARLLQFLGGGADAPVESVSVELAEAFIGDMLKWVTRGTVEGYRVYLSAAWNRGINVLGLLERNPWKVVNVAKIARGMETEVVPVRRRLPFSVEEIRRLLAEAPQPWADMVAVSWYAFGLRLSDVCMLRWEAVNLTEGYIYIVEKKTRKERFLPIVEPLRERLQQRWLDSPEGEYVFPQMARFYSNGCQGYVSTQFTAILRAMGIIGQASEGKCYAISKKSFHSIRHAVVSYLRGGNVFSADVVRDAVGHDSERVARGYFTATRGQRRQVATALAAAVGVPVPAPKVKTSGGGLQQWQ